MTRKEGSLKYGCIFSEPQIFQKSDPMFSENFETTKKKKKKSPDNCGKCYKMLFLDPIGKKQAYFKGELCISLEEQQPAVYVKMRTAER